MQQNSCLGSYEVQIHQAMWKNMFQSTVESIRLCIHKMWAPTEELGKSNNALW